MIVFDLLQTQKTPEEVRVLFCTYCLWGGISLRRFVWGGQVKPGSYGSDGEGNGPINQR